MAVTTKLKLWRTIGAAAIAGLAVGACTPAGEGGEAGQAGVSGEAGEAPGGEGGEAAIGEGGGEHGEAGVQAAYAGIDGPARTALRLQHLKGFVLIAQRVNEAGQAPEAGALVGQGVLEVYAPATDQFAGFDAAPLRAAESAGLDGKPKGEVADQLARAEAAIDQAQVAIATPINQADIAARMVDLATGLYGHVINPDYNDPIEYQHSLGAALAAQEALRTGERALRGRDASAYQEALTEMDRFVALWPGATVPDAPTPVRDMLAQASRVRLALSPFLFSAEN